MVAVTILLLAALLVAIIGAVSGIAAWRSTALVEAQAKKVDYAHERLTRAVRLLRSNVEDDILLGLQEIGAFNAPEVRAHVFQRVQELQKSTHPNVAREAQTALDIIIRQEILHYDPTVTGPVTKIGRVD
jgi:hypothetical protein